MDSSDWRAQLQPQLREGLVKEIIDTVKLWHDFNNEDELELELEKVAQSFERKTYAGATSLLDYFQIIKSKMVSMERQTHEEIYQKIKNMKEKYFPELNEMYQKIASKLQQYESLPQHTNSEQLNKLKMFKTMLERIITFLQVSKSNVLPNFKDKLGRYEKQIINFINANRPRKVMPSLQPGQLPPSSMHSLPQSQSQLTQVQSHENQINFQLQPINLQGSVATMPQNNMPSLQHNSMSGESTVQQTSMDSTAQTGQSSVDDLQEEVYQKIKNMKEKYFPELNEMYQKIASKLQQYESLPQHTNSEQLNKLKMFKTMLERIITFLQVSKSNVLPNFKDKLGPYEKQIINFINTNRPRKVMPSLQPGQLPPSSMHSMPQSQSQLTQVQSHENQINSQLQPTNLQGSVATMP